MTGIHSTYCTYAICLDVLEIYRFALSEVTALIPYVEDEFEELGRRECTLNIIISIRHNMVYYYLILSKYCLRVMITLREYSNLTTP